MTTNLSAFADLHAISRNEAERRWKSGFIAGKRETPGKHSAIVIEPRGMRDFWVQFHQSPGFRSCDDCPHIEEK